MINIQPQYIKDTAGKTLVVLPEQQFKALIDALEELEDIKLYDEAKKDNPESLPIDEAFEMIEAKRRAKP